MRLLQLVDGKVTITKELRSVPPYAILSHTWEEEQEVTFRDISTGAGKEKRGYQKILLCGQQARHDGLTYFWVDTCCIDKDSSAELSEAINSMFRWYHDAVKCYAFLADVSAPATVSDDGSQTPSWLQALRRSKYFTQGWTLQELLAPVCLEFFSLEGRLIGDRKTLERELSVITRVPARALQGSSLASFDPETRISWSVGRATTREEDLAYSLLGILGVYMPLLYGEGQENAFSRLRREIHRIQESSIRLLEKLPIAQNALFDSQEEDRNALCHEGTRVQLLRDISAWAQTSDSEHLFWLNGAAGAGKSTISRTLAHQASEGGYLGGTFFFRRGEGDRGEASKLFPTLLAQMIPRIPALTLQIQTAMNIDPSISQPGKALRLQYERLIFDPLSKIPVQPRSEPALLVIIDALDECGHEEDAQQIIYLLAKLTTIPSIRFKVLVTSRPELFVRLAFQSVPIRYKCCVLHEIPSDVIEHDIQTFLTQEMARIKRTYNKSVPTHRRLSGDWPRRADIGALVRISVPLFIVAATMCRFIADRKSSGNPDKRLAKLLESQGTNQFDATYRPLLEQILKGTSIEDRSEILHRFHTVVGSIVILVSPLSASALGNLLNTGTEDISGTLDLLHSVINIPSMPEEPIRLFHPSFGDFLLGQTELDPFHINGQKAHTKIFQACMQILEDSLQPNICRIDGPGALWVNMDAAKMKLQFPLELRYASRYWTYHMKEAGIRIADGHRVQNFLLRHFLHWLEAMSLNGVAFKTVEELEVLRKCCQPTDSEQTLAFLDDARRFILSTSSVIQLAPLQIYSSALLFTPRDSLIRTKFETDMPDWVQLVSNPLPRWNNCLQTLECVPWNAGRFHRLLEYMQHPSQPGSTDLASSKTSPGVVHAVSMSLDSSFLAAACEDGKIFVWPMMTNIASYRKTLHHSNSSVFSIAFSSDSKLLASGGEDRKVKIWSPLTGHCHRVFEGHGGWIRAVAFSPESKYIISASVGYATKIWDVSSGICQKEINSPATSIAFSPDSQFITASSADGIIRLYLMETMTCQTILSVERGHGRGYVFSTAFSSDSGYIAAGFEDSSVLIWSVASGKCLHILKHERLVFSVAFSPDSLSIASASSDTTVKIWSLKSGSLKHTLQGHGGGVRSVAWYPDGQTLASASSDGTVKVWTINDHAEQSEQSHRSGVGQIHFSPDGKTVASTSWDGTIKTWSTETGANLSTAKTKMPTAIKEGVFFRDASIEMNALLGASERNNSKINERAGRAFDGSFGISDDSCWITYNGKNLLWLPSDYRSSTSIAVRKFVVAVGSRTGKVTLLRFRENALPAV
ncbi:vegetative incompatibility protein HET-E-1 [Xylariaceae sp. FL0255]|nr:vegetative incompatibility protein HET-E-1 [Xylariaceae sp. FL0255]